MTTKAKVLFLDDEVGIVNTLRAIFRQNFDVFTSTSPAEALEIIKENHIHVVVSDQRMPEMLGVDFLSKVREISPNTIRILLTGYSDLAAIIGSINSGEVFRFINKPWNHKEIKDIISTAAEIGLQTMYAPIPKANEAEVVEGNVENSAARSTVQRQVMVLDDDKELAESITKLFDSDYKVHYARSIKEALDILEKNDISVIISDLFVAKESAVPLLRLLKKEYPLILTVMLTDLADSDLVIKLINQVQVYRFANKPIRKGALQLSVKSAMTQSLNYRNRPELLVRQVVEKIADEETQNITLKRSLFDSLRALKNRFKFFSTA